MCEHKVTRIILIDSHTFKINNLDSFLSKISCLLKEDSVTSQNPINILLIHKMLFVQSRTPPWVRGLKRNDELFADFTNDVAPPRGCVD